MLVVTHEYNIPEEEPKSAADFRSFRLRCASKKVVCVGCYVASVSLLILLYSQLTCRFRVSKKPYRVWRPKNSHSHSKWGAHETYITSQCACTSRWYRRVQWIKNGIESGISDLPLGHSLPRIKIYRISPGSNIRRFPYSSSPQPIDQG